MGNVGIYAGTFDPVHNGHIGFCLEALKKAGLERIILLPEYAPRGKQQVTDFSHRVRMLKLAAQQHPVLDVAQLTHEQFSVKRTLPELKRRFGNQLSLLLGSDVAKTLADWADVHELLREVPLIIGLRDTDTESDVKTSLERTGHTPQFSCIVSPARQLSSKAIRQRGKTAKELHPSVKLYILEHDLYVPSLA